MIGKRFPFKFTNLISTPFWLKAKWICAPSCDILLLGTGRVVFSQTSYLELCLWYFVLVDSAQRLQEPCYSRYVLNPFSPSHNQFYTKVSHIQSEPKVSLGLSKLVKCLKIFSNLVTCLFTARILLCWCCFYAGFAIHDCGFLEEVLQIHFYNIGNLCKPLSSKWQKFGAFWG